MSVVALGSAKGSPGVTTTAIALARQWPRSRPPVVAELDPAGGDIGPWLGLPPEPGIASLAATARRGLGWNDVVAHCRHAQGDLRVLAGPRGAEPARNAAAMLAPALAELLDGPVDADMLIDLGRLDLASPAVELARQADVVVLVSRPDVASLGHLAALVGGLARACRSLGLVLVGQGPYAAAEVSDALGAEVLAVLPHDPHSAGLVTCGDLSARAARRSPLWRAIADLAQTIAGLLPAESWPQAQAAWPGLAVPAAANSNGLGQVRTR